jgi:hypothetical protein
LLQMSSPSNSFSQFLFGAFSVLVFKRNQFEITI